MPAPITVTLRRPLVRAIVIRLQITGGKPGQLQRGTRTAPQNDRASIGVLSLNRALSVARPDPMEPPMNRASGPFEVPFGTGLITFSLPDGVMGSVAKSRHVPTTTDPTAE